MRFDELFKNLGYIAGTFASQMRQAAEGLPLAELDLTGPAPRAVTLTGPSHVEVKAGEVFRIEVDGPAREDVRFVLGEERLGVTGGDAETTVRVVVPELRRLSLAGSGRMTAVISFTGPSGTGGWRTRGKRRPPPQI